MSLAAYVGLASGVALVLTGVGLALARPRKAAGWWFAIFVIVWGTETALFNSFGLLEDLETIVLVERIAFGVVLVEILYLVHFTVRFTRGLDSRTEWWSWGTAGFILIVGSVLAFDPSLFSERSGPTLLSTLFINVPKFAAIYVAVGVLAKHHRRGLREHENRELRIVLGGLILYAAYTAGFWLSENGLAWAIEGMQVSVSEQIFTGLFAAATAFLLVLVAKYRWIEEVPSAWHADERTMVTAAVLAPLALGLATGAADPLGLPRVDLFGLLRIGSALVIAYGLLKFEIFEIDRKVKIGIRGSAIAAVFVVAFFTISEMVEFFVSTTVGTGAGLAAAALLTLVFKPIEEGASDLADRILPGVDDSEAYEERRKLEVYQAAVERAAGDEVFTEREKTILAGLREDLDLDPEAAHAVETDVLSHPLSL